MTAGRFLIYCVSLQLRREMIDRKSGNTELTVKVHYDNMVCILIKENNV